MPQLDFSVDHAYSALGEGEGVFLYADTVSGKEFSDKLLELVNTWGEAAYMAAKQASDFDIDDHDFQEFKQGFELFDGLAAKDLTEIWNAISMDFHPGTGQEGAFLIDLKGTLPKVPGVPSVAIEKGAAPRVALVMPVTDRAKIKQSWVRMNDAITRMVKSVNEAGLVPAEIPMQEPLESEKYGLNTYFFPIPTTTKDVNPNVSLNDDIFIASTSPTLNGQIVEALKKPAKTKRHGSYTIVNFTELHTFTKQWLKLVEENTGDFFKGNNDAQEDFTENLPLLKQALKALEELDSFTSHTRKIGDKVRGSMHFKMK
jgi:hypothetical protein